MIKRCFGIDRLATSRSFVEQGMTNPENYGFLTREGVFIETNPSNTIERQRKTDLANGKRIKGSSVNSKVDLSKNKENAKLNKSSWWKLLFGRKLNKTELKRPTNSTSNEDLRLRSKCDREAESDKVNRGRKCMSVIENQSLSVLDDVDLTTGTKTLFEYSNNKSTPSKNTKTNSQHQVETKPVKTGSNQSTNDSKFESENEKVQNSPDDVSTVILSTINEETLTKTNLKNKKEAANKPVKPPRKNLSLKHSKTSSLNPKEQSNKPKIKRSKSLISLRNPFNRAKHIKTLETQKPYSSTDDFLNDTKRKVDVMQPEKNSLSIYEKYPRRDGEHPKFLVHIQTKLVLKRRIY